MKIIETLSSKEEINLPWQQCSSKTVINQKSIRNKDQSNFVHKNRYDGLVIEEVENTNIEPPPSPSNNIFKPSGKQYKNNPTKESKKTYEKNNIPTVQSFINQTIDVNNIMQYIYNRKNPKAVPGVTPYNKISKNGGKNILILGDSMINNIKKNRLNNLVNGDVKIESFSGATTSDMTYHMVPALNKDKSDITILHIGTNDIINFKGKSPENIAKSIIDVGNNIKEKGTNHVAISSIICRKNKISCQKIINEVNEHLSNSCKDSGLIFIDNNNITSKDICSDTLHLESSGTSKLANNFIQFIDIIQNFKCITNFL